MIAVGAHTMPGSDKIAPRSRFGLNAANFFQAESIGVVMPVLGGYLKQLGWRFDMVGIALAMEGLGTLLAQTPAGYICDRVGSRRTLFAVTCAVSGICFAVLPLFASSVVWVNLQLFLSGMAGAFFAPVLAALALSLVGHRGLAKMMGENQAWNHGGNIVSAVLAILLVARLAIPSLFYAVGFASLLAGVSVFLVRASDLDPMLATGKTEHEADAVTLRSLLRERTVLTLFVSVALFHFANAPILPAVAMYVKSLGGNDQWMTATVLTAQTVMIPASLLAGKYARTHGRKLAMSIAFWVLPLRILTYTLVHSPKALVALQAFDGIGAGIYGVVIALFCADLARQKGGFNTLMGLFATALAVGGVAGPLCTGFLLQHFGFRAMFLLFAAIAAAGALWFSVRMPETYRAEAANMGRAIPSENAA